MREHVAKGYLSTVWTWSKAWWEREPGGARLHPLMRRLLEALKNGEEDGVGFRFGFFFGRNYTRRGEIYSSGHIWATRRAGGRCCCLLVSVKSAPPPPHPTAAGDHEEAIIRSHRWVGCWDGETHPPSSSSAHPESCRSLQGSNQSLLALEQLPHHHHHPSHVSFLPWIPATFAVFVFASPLSLNGRVPEVGETIRMADESGRTFSLGPVGG